MLADYISVASKLSSDIKERVAKGRKKNREKGKEVKNLKVRIIARNRDLLILSVFLKMKKVTLLKRPT